MNTTLTLLSEPRIREFSSHGFWRAETIYSAVADFATTHPNKVAIRERDRTTTYRELIDAADRLASALASAGLRHGERIAVWLPSRVEVAAATLACSRNGYVICPSLHRDHTVAEVAGLISRMRAAAVLVQPGHGADATEKELLPHLAQLEHIRLTCVLDAEPTDVIFPKFGSREPSRFHNDANSVVYLAFTSGTTGEPKGVMHSDNTLLAPTRALSEDWSLDDRSTIYSMSPLSHNLGFGAMLLSMTVGAEFVVHDLPRGDSLARRLQDTKTTFMFGVPTHAIDLLAELRNNPAARIETLRGFRISGAAVPPVVAQGLLDEGIIPQSGYGMTEAGSHHYTLPNTPVDKITGSSGRACAGYSIAIFSSEDDDKQLPAGEAGQIAGRGASLMLGYFDNQLATESSFNAEGWFLTGDVGWIDVDGYLHITGRNKDVIIRGGHNIFPAKIENLIQQHPAVARVAAIPVPDERLGERVGVVIQTKEGSSLTGSDLLSHLKDAGLSKYDMPEHLGFIKQMPVTASGKILKRQLLDFLADRALDIHPITTPKSNQK